ncbi:MAG: TetR/AcrR family transcriptional regulator [Bacteroidota bacterium]
MEKKEIIKLRILNTAKNQLLKFGFSRVKTDELAAELGISKRTLYEYFPSKEKLFEAVVEHELAFSSDKIEEIIDGIIANPDANMIDELRKIWDVNSETMCIFKKEFFDDVKKYIPEAWANIEKFRVEQMKEGFRKLTEYGKTRGYFRKELNGEIVLYINLFAVQNIITPEFLSRFPMSASDVLESIYDVLFAGVLTDKGRNEYLKCKEAKANGIPC